MINYLIITVFFLNWTFPIYFSIYTIIKILFDRKKI